MIQFNLLPDVKIEYIRARRLKRVVIMISVLVAASALTLLVLLFTGVAILQKKHLNDLSAGIKRDSTQLQSIQDLDKILTVQNQLNSLPALHDKKPVTSRLFSFIQQVTPQKANISSLQLDFETQTLNIKGGADSISTVNKFVDTLKFTDYKVDQEQKKAFSAVVLATFTRDEKTAGYEISLKFEPLIFDSKATPTLVVPNIITTRSETEKPDAVFNTQK